MFAICVFALISLSSIPVSNGIFCDSMNSISSAFSIGKYIYISQGINTIWKFDLKNGSVLDKKHTIDDIFGTGLFESVDTAFSFDFNACVGRSSAKCEIIGKAKNIALVIGERKEVSNDKYGYYAFRVNDESLLRLVGNDFSSVWGLSSGQTFNQNSTHESFWIEGNDFIYVGSAFDKNQSMLYFMINKIDDKSNSSTYHLLTRKLEESGLWSEWKDKEMPKYNGIFSANGLIYGVDGNDMIQSFGLNNGELNVKRISNSKVFFNCFGNSSLFGEDIHSRIRQTTGILTESFESYDEEYDSEVISDFTSTLDSMKHKSEVNKKPIKEKSFQSDSEDKTSSNSSNTTTARKGNSTSRLAFIRLLLIISIPNCIFIALEIH